MSLLTIARRTPTIWRLVIYLSVAAVAGAHFAGLQGGTGRSGANLCLPQHGAGCNLEC